MGGIGLIFTPVLLRRLLGLLGLSGSTTNTFWTHKTSKQFCDYTWLLAECVTNISHTITYNWNGM